MQSNQIFNLIPNWTWSIAFFLVAFVVRLLHLTETDIAGDEPFSIFIAHLEVSDIIAQLSKDNSPPLFEILLHYYINLFGVSDQTVRLLPTLFSAGVAAMVFLIGARFFNFRVGFAAAILTIFSIYHIRFAHEVRVYAMFSFLTSVSLYKYFSAMSKPTDYKWWAALAVTNVLLLYSHYTSFYLIFAQILGVVVFVPIKKCKAPFITFLVAGLLYVPYLFVFIQRLGEVSSGTWVPEPGWGEIYGNINLLLNSKMTTIGVIIAMLLGLATSRFDFGSIAFRIKESRYGPLAVICFTIPYLLMFAVSKTFLPMFMDRYVLYTSIPLFLSVAWMVDLCWNKSKYVWVGATIIICASAITTNINPPNNREIAKTVDYLAKQTEDGTEVYVCPEMFRMAVAYHLDPNIFQDINSDNPIAHIDGVLAERNFRFINSSKQIPEDLSRLVYLDAASSFVYPDNHILDNLTSRYPNKSKKHFPEIFDVYLLEAH